MGMRRFLVGVVAAGVFVALLVGMPSLGGAESLQRADCEVRPGTPKLVKGEIVSQAFIRANRVLRRHC